MVIGIVVMALTAKSPMLLVLAAAALVYGLGIGMHNIHLVARTMANARPGEENITSSATSSIRALGTAFGAAAAGMLSTVFGLGDATDPEAVGHAVALVFSVNVLPLLAAVVFMFMLLRHGRASAD
jgi:predicted MFS family arabinose efflux permease